MIKELKQELIGSLPTKIEFKHELKIRNQHEYLAGWESSTIDAPLIAETIARHSVGGNVLDLGCGPMLPAWALFHPKLKSISGMDRNSENLATIKSLATKRKQPPVFAEFYKMALALNPKGLALNEIFRTKLRDLRQGDVTEIERDWVGKFNTVTQIGCFACLDQDTDIMMAIRHVAEYLRPGGVFISVMWSAKPGFVEDPLWGGEVRTGRAEKLNLSLYREFMASYGLEPITEKESPSDDLERYQSFYCAAFRFQPLRLRHVLKFGGSELSPSTRKAINLRYNRPKKKDLLANKHFAAAIAASDHLSNPQKRLLAKHILRSIPPILCQFFTPE